MEERPDSQASRQQSHLQPKRFTSDLLTSIAIAVVTVGGPTLIWGGKIDTRVENVEKNQGILRAEKETLRTELREDLKEINRKLDLLMEKR